MAKKALLMILDGWIEAEYGIVDDTAIIEIAQTAGRP